MIISKFKGIPIDRHLTYADNLAAAINKHWRDTVAVPDGSRSSYEGNVHCASLYGVPLRVARKPHPDIVRVRRVGSNWMVVR